MKNSMPCHEGENVLDTKTGPKNARIRNLVVKTEKRMLDSKREGQYSVSYTGTVPTTRLHARMLLFFRRSKTTMPVVIKWNSANDIFVLDDTLNHSLGWTATAFQGNRSELSSAWTPAADVYETDDAIVVHVELAGIQRDSLEIVFQDGYLLVRGNRPFHSHIQPAKIYRIERTYGCFQRVFTIPKPVDPHKVSGSYEHGVVKIVLPKQPQTVAEKVTIPVTFE